MIYATHTPGASEPPWWCFGSSLAILFRGGYLIPKSGRQRLGWHRFVSSTAPPNQAFGGKHSFSPEHFSSNCQGLAAPVWSDPLASSSLALRSAGVQNEWSWAWPAPSFLQRKDAWLSAATLMEAPSPQSFPARVFSGIVNECWGRVGRLGTTEDKLNSGKWTLTDRTTEIPNPFSWVSWKHQQINWSIIFVSSS